MIKSMFIRPKMLDKLSLILWLGRTHLGCHLTASRTSVVINSEPVQVDSQLMFQRLSFIATRETHENPALLFKYELCSHPPALFDTLSLPRVANKPALADEIWDLVKHEKTVLPTNVMVELYCRGCLGLVGTQLQLYANFMSIM